MSLGRVRADNRMAWPMWSKLSRTGTATSRRCIPMRVPPMSSPAWARMCSTATGAAKLRQAVVAKDPPRLGLGHHAHRVIAVLPGAVPLQDEGPVQVLAALGGQPDPPLPEQGIDTGEHRLSGLQAGGVADLSPHDLRGGAAHHEQGPFLQLCNFQQFRRGLASLGGDGSEIKFHGKPLL